MAAGNRRGGVSGVGRNIPGWRGYIPPRARLAADEEPPIVRANALTPRHR